MESVLIGILTGIAGSVVSVLLYAAWMRKRINDRGGCPECGTPVPATRVPTSRRQALWGGWTCENCGTEMDSSGNELAEA
jgi:hypothetical protein